MKSIRTILMKTLYLLRHAKSSWAGADLKDSERPLNSRGEHDASVMASRLREEGPVQAIISSTAVRAISTARLIAEGTEFPTESIVLNSGMYLAGPKKLLEVVQNLDSDLSTVMLVCHNPTITEFANCMSGATIDNVPTSGLVKLRFNSHNWADAMLGSATLVEFDYPKKGR